MEEENEKIREFAQQQQQREAERMAVKQQKEEAMSAVQHKVMNFNDFVLFLYLIIILHSYYIFCGWHS